MTRSLAKALNLKGVEYAIMKRGMLCVLCVATFSFVGVRAQERQQYPSFDYGVARAHEIKPHRRTIPLSGVEAGENQLRITLKVSPAGQVLDATASSGTGSMQYWPEIKAEVLSWKFAPFEVKDRPVMAQVEEYVDLVPPERLPKIHVPAPPVRPNSTITIVLQRSACYGTCPSYTVAVSTDAGIVFNGYAYVAASGRHTDTVDPDAVRVLARKFVAVDFYSMDAEYRAGVTDNPTYVLSVTIDGHTKKVVDYVGSWVGMPAVITDLENAVDTLARTQRWITGSEGTHGQAR